MEIEDFAFGPEEPRPDLQAQTNGLLGTTDVRCKRQTFKANFKQVGLYTAIRYEGQFRVCYRPGQEIVSWGKLHGDTTYTLLPWEWRGNASGYPYGVKNDRIQLPGKRGGVPLQVRLRAREAPLGASNLLRRQHALERLGGGLT